jgi:hypothetical protein
MNCTVEGNIDIYNRLTLQGQMSLNTLSINKRKLKTHNS